MQFVAVPVQVTQIELQGWQLFANPESMYWPAGQVRLHSVFPMTFRYTSTAVSVKVVQELH